MTSTRPYLIRAFFDWIVDNHFTPYVVIDTTKPGVNVPSQHVENDQIVLNISPTATSHLSLGNDVISFRASFSGVLRVVEAPVTAVIAIYARENGRGMIFSEDHDEGGGDDGGPDTTTKAGKDDAGTKDKDGKGKVKAPFLKVVK